MKKQVIVIAVTVIAVAQLASAIDYKKNTISGGGTTKTSVHSFSSSTSIDGSNATTVVSGTSPSSFQFGDFDWEDRGFGKKTLDQKIRDAEQRLFKLYFIRDVCRTLEDEIKISFEKKDIREVMSQVSGILKVELPYEVPDGTFIVEKSDVSGMPTDQFLSSIAQVCGLHLQYERNKLIFVKQEKKEPSSKAVNPAK